MKIKLKNLLNKFYIEKKALVSFNIQNIDQLYLLKLISLELRTPVMAQFSAKYISYFENIVGLKNLVYHYYSPFLYFHLDHCLDKNLIKKCIDSGFDSVMFDGSSLQIEDNIKGTNEIYNYASRSECLLEVELGAISGVEDGFGSDEGDYFSFNDLIKFNKEASFDLLALAIGNAHGVYTSTSNIKISLLREARELIGDTKFVLHGGTGMEIEKVIESVENGVVKINFSTDLKIVTNICLNAYLDGNKKLYDHLKFLDSLKHLKNYFSNHILKYSK